MKKVSLYFLVVFFSASASAQQPTILQDPLNNPGRISNHPEEGILPYNAPCKDCQEDLSKRTGVRREFYKVEEGGTKTVYIQQSLGAMNYLDENGYWRAVDPLLKKESESVYAARHQTSAVVIDFGNRYTSLNYAGKEFRFNKNISLSHISNGGIETSLGEGDWSHLQQTINYAQTIFTLQDFYPGIDLQFIATEGSVESNFILRNKQQYTDGWLVMNQELDVPAGLHADNSDAERTGDRKRKGMLLINDNKKENYFYFHSATAHDANESFENIIDMSYALEADHLKYFLPVQWLNDPATVYPVVMDPFVTTSDSLSIYAVRSSGYSTVCDTLGCNYFMNNFSMPAGCEITYISCIFGYYALAPCVRQDGGFAVTMTSSSGSCQSGHYTCGGGLQGGCIFVGAQLLVGPHTIAPCLLPPQCNPYSVNFKLHFRRCNHLAIGGCDSTCIFSYSVPWIMEVQGRTAELTNVTWPQGICDSTCIDLKASSAWGVPPYSYIWQPGNMTGDSINICPDSSSAYFLTMTDACGNTDTATTTISVVQGQNPGFDILPNDSVCGGTPMTFTSNSSYPDSLFRWFIQTDTMHFFPNTKTVNYTPPMNQGACTVTMILEVNDSNGTCYFTDVSPFIVTSGLSPLLSVEPLMDSLCPGETITLTANTLYGGTAPVYHWYLKGVVIPAADSATHTASYFSSSQLVVSMTSNDTCSAGITLWDTAYVNIANPLMPGVMILASADTVCDGSQVVFNLQVQNSGANPLYLWFQNGILVDSGSSFITTVNAGDEIVVEMIADLACPLSDTAMDTASVVVVPVILPGANIVQSPNYVCAGDSVTFSATLSNFSTQPSYRWYINGITVSFNPTFTTAALNNGDTILLRLIAPNACGPDTIVDSLIVTIHSGIPEVNISFLNDTICAGDITTFYTTTVYGGTSPSYQWMINGIPVAGATNSTFITGALLAGDSLSVQLTSSEPCADPQSVSTTANIYIDNCLGVEENSSNVFSLHPNPATDELTIFFPGKSAARRDIFIVDMTGRELFRRDLKGEDKLLIDISSFARAVYFVKVFMNDEWCVQRLVLK